MNIEQAVLENLRRLPSVKQQDVLTFICSLVPPDLTAERPLRQHIIEKVLPALADIQRFYDGLPSAVYAYHLLEVIKSIPTQFSTDTLAPFFQTLYQILTVENRWIRYPVEFYQAVYSLLSDISAPSQLTEVEVQKAIQTLEQLNLSLMGSGVAPDDEWEDDEA